MSHTTKEAYAYYSSLPYSYGTVSVEDSCAFQAVLSHDEQTAPLSQLDLGKGGTIILYNFISQPHRPFSFTYNTLHDDAAVHNNPALVSVATPPLRVAIVYYGIIFD